MADTTTTDTEPMKEFLLDAFKSGALDLNRHHCFMNCLPTPRVVALNLDGITSHYYTWSDAPLDDLCLGDLMPFGLLDAQVWLERILEDHNREREQP